MADKPITDLVAASQITETDFFVLEQAGTAKKLTGRVLFNWLMSMVDGHGGIRNIEKTGTEGLTDTYRITFSDGGTFSYNISNGRSIREISLLGRNGLVDEYAIRFNDGADYRFSVTNGAKGDTGEKTYLWIKYASQMPTEESHSFGDEPDRYIGVYWGDLPTAPTEWHLYKWSKIQGDQGEPGNQGNPGVTPQLSIGVVTTVDENQQASASIVGSAENPILNLSLPRGRPGADGSGSSDWNVNAPGANGYVYNRTHYVEDEEALAFDGNYEFSGNSVSIPVSLSTEKIGAEKNYRVVFSGLSYDLIMRDVSPVFSQKTFAFGNLRLIHNSFEDTGEPFCIKYIFPTETIEIVSPDSSGRSVPVAVYYGEKIVKLDNKFIDADWMAKKTIVGVTGVILDTTTVSFESSTIIDGFAEIAIVAGGEYIVTWNNVDYTVTAYETDGFTCLGNSVLGGGNVETNEPFYIASLGGPRCMVFKTPEVQQTITMKIVGNGKTVYSKLPNEYLPDNIVSDELISKSVEEYLKENQISSPEISLEDFEQNGRTGTVITVTETKPGMLPSISKAYVYNGTNGTSAYATVTKANGVTTITTKDATGTHTAEVYDGSSVSDDHINRLIGEKSIPIPATAKVGQTIQVSAVNESDKPTAWEAVDFPSGGGEEWRHIRTVTIPEDITTDTSGVSFVENTNGGFTFAFGTDENGNEFELKDLLVRYKASCPALTNKMMSGAANCIITTHKTPYKTTGTVRNGHTTPASIGKTGVSEYGWFKTELMGERRIVWGASNLGVNFGEVHGYREAVLNIPVFTGINMTIVGDKGFEIGNTFDFYGR